MTCSGLLLATTVRSGFPTVAGYGLFNRNIVLPSFTTLRRYEFADNFTLVRGHHTIKMGVDVLLHGDLAESHTFMSGRFSFGQLPGGVLSPCLAFPNVPTSDGGCGIPGELDPVPVTA